MWIPTTTPSTTSICPYCIAHKLNWHPNGDWSWSWETPDKIKCNVCKQEFPNDNFIENVVYTSKWDPNQKFSYYTSDKVKPQKCMNYENCLPSISGVIRGYKLHQIMSDLINLGCAYALSGDTKYALKLKEILLIMAERIPKYLVYEGYGYSEYADCDPHEAAIHINDLGQVPGGCNIIRATGIVENAQEKLYSGYWSASRIGTSGTDGQYVEKVALAYDLIADVGPDVMTDEERQKIEINLIKELSLLGRADDLINNKAVSNLKAVALRRIPLTSGP